MYDDRDERPLAYKDAIFLSPHKYIGGPSTPGILVVRRELLRNRVPDVPGGGTVAYVNPDEHAYLDDPTQREEGGTPAIVESIRAGLVFQLKQAVGFDVIRAREASFLRRAVAAWQQEPTIEILGNVEAERLSIISFVVSAPSGRYLHHNFVVAVLNDLFGIQSRGGCSCAGPYGHRLLGIDSSAHNDFARGSSAAAKGSPGWVRVISNYFISDRFRYVVKRSGSSRGMVGDSFRLSVRPRSGYGSTTPGVDPPRGCRRSPTRRRRHELSGSRIAPESSPALPRRSARVVRRARR
jgi:hypothetical protein